MIARRGASQREKVSTLRRVLGGLAELGAGTVIRREPWSSEAMRGKMEAVLARFEEEFSIAEGERRLLEAVRRRSNALSSASLAVVWSHPDLGPSNVLVRSGGITVIDWAKASPGLPLQDVLYLLLIASADISGARRESQRLEVFRRVFLAERSGDELGTAAREGIERGLEALGADRRFLPILLVFLWVNRSVGRLDRSRAVSRGAAGVNPKAGNPYPLFVRALAEGADELFRRYEEPGPPVPVTAESIGPRAVVR
jgi:hypothetical protein